MTWDGLRSMFDGTLGFHPAHVAAAASARGPRLGSPMAKATAIRYSDVSLLDGAGRSWVERARWIPPVLRTVGIVLLIVCIARPIKANERSRVFVEGVAIQSVVDRSGSMEAVDFELDAGRVSRLTAVKKVLTEFIVGDDELSGRPDDLVGLITFARHADTASPLTLDHAHVVGAIDAVDIARIQSEDGTAIGDSIALAVERLRELDDRSDSDGRRIKSRVIVLLTDGENNAGDIDPDTAAAIAEAFDVKIYAIGVGSNGVAMIPARDLFGNVRMIPQRVSIDEETLQRISESTGGRYFRATDTDSLRDIYAEIDRLEKTTTEQRRYRMYRDLSVSGVDVAGFPVLPLILLASRAAARADPRPHPIPDAALNMIEASDPMRSSGSSPGLVGLLACGVCISVDTDSPLADAP